MKRVLWVLALTLTCCKVRGKAELEQAAGVFAAKMSERVRGVECVTSDTDNDGYASCTVFLDGGEQRAILCARDLRFEGCKLREERRYLFGVDRK